MACSSDQILEIAIDNHSMIQTIRVSSNNDSGDTQGAWIGTQLKHHSSVRKVRVARVYRLEGVDEKDSRLLASKLFVEPINQISSLNKPLFSGNVSKIEIAYKPGVMNPEIGSILKAAKDLGISVNAADSSWEYYLFGKVSFDTFSALAKKLRLFNPTIEYILQKEPDTLRIIGAVGKTAVIPIRSMNADDLQSLSKDKLFLNADEMTVIQHYFIRMKRDPTDCELETIAQTWSEHCAHKTFKAKLIVDGKKKEPLIIRLKKEALKHKKHIISAFVDNSGVMDFYDGVAICGKVETHNSPSAIEPYGGAMTGSGGVFRDVLGTGLGAKTIASTDIFCFAHPSLSPKDLPTGCLPPAYLLKRVVTGVKDYGNRMGIPTNNGSVHFHNDFRAKPTIIVGAYGMIPTQQAIKGTVRIGDRIIAVGGKTGRDGIHGATFSSAEMTDRTLQVNSSAVQIGNAIEEKRMFDAILEARNQNCIHAIQDCGAGGFSSAIGEMGENTGVKVDLAKAPLKYQGLSPWEIWVSESQERMVLAIPQSKVNTFLKICKKYNVEATNLGIFDGSKMLRVSYGKQSVCNLDMQFLHHGLPQRTMHAKRKLSATPRLQTKFSPIFSHHEWIQILSKLFSHGNICSKEPIVRLYDHTVQGTNILQPYTGVSLDSPSDAAVMTPLLGKPYGMITSHGLNPILNRFDPYWGSIWACAEAVANYVAVGGDYKNASLINNYIWPFPDSESLWSLDQSVEAVIAMMRLLKIPVISGKDSLSSTYRNAQGTVIKIPPVLCISMFGKIPDVKKTVSSDFKKIHSVVYLLGTLDTKNMGGSIFYEVLHREESHIPHVNLAQLPNVLSTLYRAIHNDAILSCHDVSEGGLITSVFEMCVGGNMGVHLTLKKSASINMLFNETAGCFIVEVENDAIAETVFKGIPYIKIGTTLAHKSIRVQKGKSILFDTNIAVLQKAWKKTMNQIFS